MYIILIFKWDSKWAFLFFQSYELRDKLRVAESLAPDLTASVGEKPLSRYATSVPGLLSSVLVASLFSSLLLLEAPHLLLCAVSLAGRRLGGTDAPSMPNSHLPYRLAHLSSICCLRANDHGWLSTSPDNCLWSPQGVHLGKLTWDR